MVCSSSEKPSILLLGFFTNVAALLNFAKNISRQSRSDFKLWPFDIVVRGSILLLTTLWTKGSYYTDIWHTNMNFTKGDTKHSKAKTNKQTKTMNSNKNVLVHHRPHLCQGDRRISPSEKIVRVAGPIHGRSSIRHIVHLPSRHGKA